MTALQRAIEYVKAGYPYDLAIHKASQETGTPTKVIADEFLHKKQEKKKAKSFKKNYQSTVPSWVKRQQETD